MNINCNGIKLGSIVTLYDYRGNKKVIYRIVPMNQGNPFKNKISIKSPLAIALVGNNVGDIIEVAVYSGVEKYKVINISN